MADDKVKEFYEQVVKPNGYFADEQEFRTVVSDPNKSKEFFDNALKAEGIFNDYSEFETVLGAGLKKNTLPNESTTPSQQPTTPSATSTSESKKVTTEFDEPAVMLEEVEIKPKPEIGYLQSFMEGIESYDDLQVGYDVLRSGDKAKIIDYYNTRYNNSLSQTPNDNFIKNALRTIGGTVPMMGKVATGGAVGGAIGSTIPVVGTAVGAASGTIAEGIYEGQKLSKSSAFEEAYFEAKSQNKTDDEAFEIANNVSKVAQIAGGVEGGISGLAGGTATKAGTSVLKNLAKEIIADATVGATAAGARRGTENIAAQQQGLERKTTAGIGEEMTGEAAFSFGLGLLLSPITQGKNLIGNRRKKIITAVAATDAPKAITTIDKAVEKGEVSQEDADALKVEIVQTAKAFEATPESMPYEEREALTPVIAERQKLQKEFEKVSPATQPIVQAKIELIDKSIPIPLPPKYMDTAGQNTSELKDGQLYITRKGDVRMWDAAQKQFLEPPKSFEVEAKKETEQVNIPQFNAPQIQVEGEFQSPYTPSLKKLGYSDNQIASLSIEQQQQIVDKKIEAPVTDIKQQTVKTDVSKENLRQERIAEAQKKLDEELKTTEQPAVETVQAEAEVTTIPQAGSVGGTNPALANVESTAKALEGVDMKSIISPKKEGKIIDGFEGGTKIYRSGSTGRYFTTDKEYIQEGGFKGTIKEFQIPQNSSLLDLRDIDFKGILDLATNEEIQMLRKPVAKNSKEAKEQGNIVDAILKRNGYDGYIIKDAGDTKDYDTVVFRKDRSPDYTTKSISEAYHKAKADGSNPELVKAVEELLAPESQAKPLQTEAESKVATLPTAEIDQVDAEVKPTIFDQYDNTKGASKKDKVIEQFAKESGKDKADRVRDIIDNFDAIKSRLQELISEGKIDNIEIRC